MKTTCSIRYEHLDVIAPTVAPERDRLLADNRALRSALEMIRDSDDFMGGTFVKELQHIARDALAKASHD